MGLLSEGTPLTWKDAKKFRGYIKEHGVQQFLNLYKRVSGRENDELKWGDEMEYQVVHVDHLNHEVRLSLRGPELIKRLGEAGTESGKFLPEYGRHMIEGIPRGPYSSSVSELASIETSLRNRREHIQKHLLPDERVFSVPSFPLMGVGLFTEPRLVPGGRNTESLFIPDGIINPHPRFGTLTANIRKRRGSRVSINVPVFNDANTSQFHVFPGEAKMERTLSESKRALVARIEAAARSLHAKSLKFSPRPVSPSIKPAPALCNLKADELRACRFSYTEPSFMERIGSDRSSSGSLETGGSSAPGSHMEGSGPRRKVDLMWPGVGDSMEGQAMAGSGSCLADLQRPRCPEADPDCCEIDPHKTPALPGCIYMDAMCFGMGCCGLQCTFQLCNVHESRYLYDQYQSLCPVMLALSANSPVFRGLLADWDARYNVIGSSVDDRTRYEMGLDGSCSFMPIPQPRYGTVDSFISLHKAHRPEYNDVYVPVDTKAQKHLEEAGIDHLLAQHIAHLFVRDPLVIYEDGIELDDSVTTEHFENIQSTNWQTVRWKPPPADDPNMGWRVEFRPMDVQVTDFENACVLSFIFLLSRIILSFDLNFYQPISKIQANMHRAHRRQALRKEKFWFRRHLFNENLQFHEAQIEQMDTARWPNAAPGTPAAECRHNPTELGREAAMNFSPHPSSVLEKTVTQFPVEMESSPLGGVREVADTVSSPLTLPAVMGEVGDLEEEDCPVEDGVSILLSSDEIVNGKHGYFVGLVPLCRYYIEKQTLKDDERATILKQLDFLSDRAAGRLLTGAEWQRQFIVSHPAYKHDSVVTQNIAYDLMLALDDIASGRRVEPELTGAQVKADIKT